MREARGSGEESHRATMAPGLDAVHIYSWDLIPTGPEHSIVGKR